MDDPSLFDEIVETAEPDGDPRMIELLRSMPVTRDTTERLWRATVERDEAIARVERGVDPVWNAMAYEFVLGYLRQHRTMFVDDVWSAGLPPTRENRALGGVFKRMAHEGRMEKDGTYRKSVRSHLTEKPVWRSLIYEEA